MPVTLVSALAITACSSAPGGDSSPSPSPSNGQEEQGGNGGEEKEHLTLTWRVAAPHVDASAIFPGANEDFVKQTIEEKFNVTLNMTSEIYSSEFDTKMTMQLSADPPDLFVAGGVQSQGYALDGLLADMTEFVTPETMPNYFKYWVTEEELERYGIENSFVRAPIPFARNVYRSYYIRKDWLDNLGLSVPTSYDEMLEVMRAFSQGNPDPNSRQRTYGMTAAGGGRTFSWDFPGFVENDVYTFILDKENGTFRDGQTDLALVQVLDSIKMMMDEGLVEPEWFLNSGTEHWNKAIQGVAGIIAGGSMDFMLEGNPNSILNRTKQLNPNADWVPFNPHPDKGIALTQLPGNPFLFHINVAEQRPDHIKRTVEILDWLASEEGYLLTHYGQEGTHYTRDGNQITLNVDEYNEITQWLTLYSFFTPPNEIDKLGLEVIDPRFTDRDREVINTITSYQLKEHIGTNVAPPPGTDLGGMRTRQNELITQILFDEPDASNWPKYREELMTTYGGQGIFEAYAEQIGSAHGIEVKFVDGP
ncbi:extracellular solute-binding protein [Paenibacillus senegalensis]|uniref:extracellular solute-binding protein n=1 Tax=Paenibacillus senegalensis TaxID=1465766 RepID=UPI000289107E|nr:extracellular solute-binding protein [Paenibacillus senegalensis]